MQLSVGLHAKQVKKMFSSATWTGADIQIAVKFVTVDMLDNSFYHILPYTMNLGLFVNYSTSSSGYKKPHKHWTFPKYTL